MGTRTRAGTPVGTWRRPVAGLAAALGLAVAAGCAPPPSDVVGPGQHFVGVVNGSTSEAVVTTVCGGPVWEGRTGPPLAGQTLSLRRVDSGGGSTGTSSVVFAQPTTASMAVVPFDRYDVAQPLPTDLQLPCDGTGLITFTPCFGIAGCTAGASEDVVKVRFVNIAD